MIVAVFLLTALLSHAPHVNCDHLKELLNQKKLPPCKSCKVFIESLKKGIERTANGKFEGGDTDWEEKKLGTYANSEIRLTEIQEKLCSDVEEGKDQCYAMHEEHDSVLEDWWFNKQAEEPDVYKYFCIEKLQYCCPENHFGANCTPCEGYPDNICNNNGKCKGAGTRKGNGNCQCDAGYSNDYCDQCADGYYEAYKDEKKLLCSKCHSSCARGRCTKAGAIGCLYCNKGWIMVDNKGCLDINECAATTTPCKIDEFCVNNEGSYRCLSCDRSCHSCTGDGPDMCKKCAQGYVLRDSVCIDAEQESRKQHVYITRYLTYLGLCIATCIIFNKNTMLAAIIGIAVAIYISTSEYVLNSHHTPKTEDITQTFRTTS
ncbi:hypothetical protein WA026_004698 [Henosepilachna vigintioctopunctata]|uniref:EGF-like domain-containing protein n=1 Tax=Henosepilachna vigintioctopunctata TaxID=420089 RepID=A0AAW1VAT0_9CUCU